MGMLKPYFVVDSRLVYTLLAMMHKIHLADFLNSEVGQQMDIPLDAVLACAQYHIIRETQYHVRLLTRYCIELYFKSGAVCPGLRMLWLESRSVFVDNKCEIKDTFVKMWVSEINKCYDGF